jgi:hypothetical protein
MEFNLQDMKKYNAKKKITLQILYKEMETKPRHKQKQHDFSISLLINLRLTEFGALNITQMMVTYWNKNVYACVQR